MLRRMLNLVLPLSKPQCYGFCGMECGVQSHQLRRPGENNAAWLDRIGKDFPRRENEPLSQWAMRMDAWSKLSSSEGLTMWVKESGRLWWRRVFGIVTVLFFVLFFCRIFL